MFLRAALLSLTLFAVVPFNVDSLFAAESGATDAHTHHRAKFNYQMFCQGCHVADGSGHKSVPELKGFIHKFMSSQQGREYLIRVPGSANSTLNNEELAELMNWMLREFGNSQEAQWQPYQAEEVGEYRKRPLNETVRYRENLIASLNLESEL